MPEDEEMKSIMDELEKEMFTEGDPVYMPKHYTRWKIEPIKFIQENDMEFWRGNIIKYVSRAGYKMYEGEDKTGSEITDLKKVIRYAEMRINKLDREVDYDT